MKQVKIKQFFCKFSKFKIGWLFKSLYLETKKHYPISDLFLIVLLYILMPKRDVRKKVRINFHWH